MTALEKLPPRVTALEVLPPRVAALEKLPPRVAALEGLPPRVAALELFRSSLSVTQPSGWTVRRYPTNTAECWKRHTLSLAINQSYGSGFYYATTPVIPFPVKFGGIPTVNITAEGYHMLGVRLATVTGTGFSAVVFNPGSVASSQYTLNISVRGVSKA